MGQPRPQFLFIFVLFKQNCSEKSVGVSGINSDRWSHRKQIYQNACHFTIEKICVRFFTDFSADARSEKRKITLVATFVDICFSLPRSIPAIAEKRTRKIAGTHSSKFVFYGASTQVPIAEILKLCVLHTLRPFDVKSQ